MDEWSEKQLAYLHFLSQNCQRLAQRFNSIHSSTKSYQNKIRIPVIIFSSVAGIFSFSSGGFGDSMSKPISLSVGVINIGIAIANSIDSLFGLTDIIQKASKASVDFMKLKEKIDMELQLPTDKRSSSADVFIRDCHNEHLSIQEACPQVLKNLRWVMPTMDTTPDVESIDVATTGCFKNDSEPPTPKPTISIRAETF